MISSRRSSASDAPAARGESASNASNASKRRRTHLARSFARASDDRESARSTPHRRCQPACQSAPNGRLGESANTDSRAFCFLTRARHPPNSLARPSCSQIFLRRKSAAAISREASAASLKTLSSRSAGVVHDYSGMDEMPISQWFLESIAERTRRSHSRAMMRVPLSSRRVIATCRDAAGARGYTFR
jgi:hypothetical protein